MLYAFGVGEAPISISGEPDAGGPLEHTVRAVGPVSTAICRAEPGTELGLRGPFGSSWPLAEAARPPRRDRRRRPRPGAAARPALLEALARRERLAGLVLLCGGRSPGELLYADELRGWGEDPRLEVGVTVDAAERGWSGHVGVVTTLIGAAPFDPARAVAFVFGPEVMMRFTAQALLDRGIDPADIHVSLERNMKCAVDPVRSLPVRPDLRLPRGPGDEPGRDRPLLRGAGAVSGAARAEPPARRLEVRLLRRLPAQPARPRGRAAGARRRGSRSPTSSRPARPTSRAPTTSRWSRAR